MSESLLTNTTISHYRILEKLGAGGMGEVYLAEDTRLERTVALKILPSGVASNEDRMRRFTQEAKAAAALNHPAIAHVYEIGESDGTRFIAMEYVDGVTLSEKIYKEKTPLGKVLKYLIQTAEALAKAHAAGIVHRDLKPDNIMVTRDDYAKILDFGLAKLIEPKKESTSDGSSSEVDTAILPPQHSTPGMILGTIGYMSPEQAQGRVKEIDHRSDIFSFGCILFEAATGQRPFAGKDQIDSLHKIIHAPTPQIKDLNPDAPPDLQRIVRRCLAKEPEQRYQSVKEVAIELKELRQEMRSTAEAGLSSSPEKTAPLQISNSKDHPTNVGHTGAASTSDAAVHSTSSAEYLVNQIKRHKTGVFITLVTLVAVVGLGFGLYKFFGAGQSTSAGTPVRVTPLTSSRNPERNPAFSPDGKQVAYAWTGENNENFDIYVKITDAGKPLRLTTDPAREMSPAWSPDNRFIAFLRGTGENRGFYVVPALGGAERKIADAFGWNQSGVMPQMIDWSPDGKTLALVDKTSEEEPWSIFLLSIETGEKRRLTEPPAQTHGDGLVAFSPDGQTVAFGRKNALNGNIFTIPITGGEPARITSEDALTLHGLDWTSDGENFVFAAEIAGRSTLWMIAAAGGSRAPVSGVGENVGDLSVSPQGNHLIYTKSSIDINLWRLELANRAGSSGSGGRRNQNSLTKIVSSTREEEHPQFSPNGQRIAFRSNRSGSHEIWVSDSEGQNAMQLTNLANALTTNPRWSPDGRFIAFDSSASGNADIYLMNADGGGSPRRLTTDATEDAAPSWSRDGRHIYFSSKRTGRNEVWKMPAAGGDPVQVTRHGGFITSESTDGRILYYTKGRIDPTLWSVNVEGGEETKVFDYRIGRNFAVGERGIYFFLFPQDSGEPYTVEFFDFATRKTTRLATLEGQASLFAVYGMTVSPDERWIIYAQRDQLEFDLILVENFR